jgi:hypothetical protein
MGAVVVPEKLKKQFAFVICSRRQYHKKRATSKTNSHRICTNAVSTTGRKACSQLVDMTPLGVTSFPGLGEGKVETMSLENRRIGLGLQ